LPRICWKHTVQTTLRCLLMKEGATPSRLAPGSLLLGLGRRVGRMSRLMVSINFIALHMFKFQLLVKLSAPAVIPLSHQRIRPSASWPLRSFISKLTHMNPISTGILPPTQPGSATPSTPLRSLSAWPRILKPVGKATRRWHEPSRVSLPRQKVPLLRIW